MTLTAGGTNLVTNESINQVSLDSGSLKFTDETATGPIPMPSINQDINLTSLFTTDTGSLQYRINVTKVSIDPSQTDKTITAELLIKLPLEFTVSGDLVTIEGTSSSYKELKLKPLKSISDSGSSDLFGRSGKEDDLLRGVDGVTLGYYNYKNEILDGLSLFTGKITNGTWEGDIWELNRTSPPDGIIIDFDQKDVAYPFTPQFKILVKDSVNLKIGRLTGGAKLDFSLVVDAQATIDQTITF
jgi:hypothetical protein